MNLRISSPLIFVLFVTSCFSYKSSKKLEIAEQRPPVKCTENSPERRGEEGCTILTNRPLPVKKIIDNEYEIRFDIVLRKEYLPDENVFHKVSGVYRMDDQSMMEFYRDGDFLFLKWNNMIRGRLSYSCSNTFTGGVNDTEAKFELQPNGNTKVEFRLSQRREIKLDATKILMHKGQ